MVTEVWDDVRGIAVLKTFLLMAIMAAVMVTPAGATTSFERYSILPQAKSPVVIHYCAAWLSDTSVGNIDYFVNAAVTFMNDSNQSIAAVRFRFDLYSNFNESLRQLYGTKEGDFSPHVLIEARRNMMGSYNPEWSWINITPSARQVVCSVDSVRFSDGTIWRANFGEDVRRLTATPVPVSSSIPAAEILRTPAPSAHPATCTVKLSSGATIRIPWENEGCAAARRSFAQHPKTCRVKLASGSEIEIPWTDENCRNARPLTARSSPSPAPPSPAASPLGTASALPSSPAIYTWTSARVDGHPVVCLVLEAGNTTKAPWDSDICAPARDRFARENN